jgi:hypothetical protein
LEYGGKYQLYLAQVIFTGFTLGSLGDTFSARHNANGEFRKCTNKSQNFSLNSHAIFSLYQNLLGS